MAQQPETTNDNVNVTLPEVTPIWHAGALDEGNVSDDPVYSELTAALYGSSWYGRVTPEELEFYRAWIDGSRTLEVGSGTGRLSIPLLQAGCDVYGLEISTVMLGQLRSTLSAEQGQRFICWNALQTPFPVDDETFGAVIIPFSSFSLMHNHVQDPGENRMFHEFYRVLRPGGLVILNDARTYKHDRNRGMASFGQQELDGKSDQSMTGVVQDDTLILTFEQWHPDHGEIKEEWISTFYLQDTRLVPQLVMRQREIRYTRVRDGEVLEAHHEVIPVWDVSEYPLLGEDANFEYLTQEVTPSFHVSDTVNHIFRKT